jgi:hypothetical protein
MANTGLCFSIHDTQAITNQRLAFVGAVSLENMDNNKKCLPWSVPPA